MCYVPAPAPHTECNYQYVLQMRTKKKNRLEEARDTNSEAVGVQVETPVSAAGPAQAWAMGRPPCETFCFAQSHRALTGAVGKRAKPPTSSLLWDSDVSAQRQ